MPDVTDTELTIKGKAITFGGKTFSISHVTEIETGRIFPKYKRGILTFMALCFACIAYGADAILKAVNLLYGTLDYDFIPNRFLIVFYILVPFTIAALIDRRRVIEYTIQFILSSGKGYVYRSTSEEFIDILHQTIVYVMDKGGDESVTIIANPKQENITFQGIGGNLTIGDSNTNIGDVISQAGAN